MLLCGFHNSATVYRLDCLKTKESTWVVVVILKNSMMIFVCKSVIVVKKINKMDDVIKFKKQRNVQNQVKNEPLFVLVLSISFFKHYSRNRISYVEFHNFNSFFFTLFLGILRGFILKSLLFLILTEISKESIKLMLFPSFQY